ncbi:MAG TPA: hypothetical protein PK821_04230 [Victivallales bacterium]|nr:hypothetical protein [Victivallales bacterium]
MRTFLALVCMVFSVVCYGYEALNLIPSSSDYVVELIPDRALKKAGFSDFLRTVPEYSLINAAFSAKGVDFEKSIKKAVIAGMYSKRAVIILETTVKEPDLLSMIKDRKPETFAVSGRNVHKFFEKNKTIFLSYFANDILMISEDPTLISEVKGGGLAGKLSGRFMSSENSNVFGAAHVRNIASLGGDKHEKGINPSSIFGKVLEEAFFSFGSGDGTMIEVSGELLSDPKNEKMLQFQTNTLFLIVVAKISSGNQKLANQIMDSFKISSRDGVVKMNFKIDPSLMTSETQNGNEFQEDFFKLLIN